MCRFALAQEGKENAKSRSKILLQPSLCWVPSLTASPVLFPSLKQLGLHLECRESPGSAADALKNLAMKLLTLEVI